MATAACLFLHWLVPPRPVGLIRLGGAYCHMGVWVAILCYRPSWHVSGLVPVIRIELNHLAGQIKIAPSPGDRTMYTAGAAVRRSCHDPTYEPSTKKYPFRYAHLSPLRHRYNLPTGAWCPPSRLQTEIGPGVQAMQPYEYLCTRRWPSYSHRYTSR